MFEFQDLLPDFICDVVASCGFHPTGQLFQLNSYENRVYQVGLEKDPPLVIKFYRPNRWNELQLQEEHLILSELAKHEVPVVQPLEIKKNELCPSLGKAGSYYFCLYPKFGGHEEADLNAERFEWLGRTLARAHLVMSSLPIKHRLKLNAQTYGYDQLDSLFQNPWLPDDLWTAIEDMILTALSHIEKHFKNTDQVFAVHGDCHLGNVLWNKTGPTLVDFDDVVLAPSVQDMWMLFWGNADEKAEQQKQFLKGYELFREFDDHLWRLTESLRTLRMIRHTAWIGDRYEEPIFKKAFSYYHERKFWEEFLLNIKEQCSLLQES